MSIFYVFQGKTYNQERDGGYVWSPKLTKDGKKNAGYENMTQVHKGDYILHNNNGEVVAISLALSNCYSAGQPAELKNAQKDIDWADDGYKINLEYHEFEVPLKITEHKEYLTAFNSEESAFDFRGIGKRQYMCHISDFHANYILSKLAESETNTQNKKLISEALAHLKFAAKENEYTKAEIEGILELLKNHSADDKPKWKFEKKPQEFTEISGKLYPKRDINMAAAALTRADYKCEVDSKHKTFTSIANKPYTEAFHLVPLNKWYCYNTSLDVPENIVSLCPNCYKKILFGNYDEKYNVLIDLWEKREKVLEKAGIKLSCEEFFKYYGMLVTITV